MKIKDILNEGWAEDIQSMNQPELNNASEQEQLAAVRKNPQAIYNINQPSVNVQRTAIKLKPSVISFFKNTQFDDNMIMLALSLNGFVIVNISNPTEEQQLAAVTNHMGALSSIVHPTTKVIKLALTNSSNFIYDHLYDNFKFEVNRLFKDNAILMKKWLRYGEQMRDQR